MRALSTILICLLSTFACANTIEYTGGTYSADGNFISIEPGVKQVDIRIVDAVVNCPGFLITDHRADPDCNVRLTLVNVKHRGNRTLGCVWLKNTTDHVHIEGCDFANYRRRGIQIGDNDGDLSKRRNIRIVDTRVADVIEDRPDKQESHGIWVYGSELTIERCTVERVSSHVPEGAEAIYTKALGQRIVGNVVRDGGNGGILCKGSSKAGQAVISHNRIYRCERGIGVFAGYVNVHNNHTFDCRVGAYLWDYQPNVAVYDNSFHRSTFAGIFAKGHGSNLYIARNRIAGVTTAEGSARGIALTTQGGVQDCLIEGNIISGLVSKDGSNNYPIWVRVMPTTTGERIENSHILNNKLFGGAIGVKQWLNKGEGKSPGSFEVGEQSFFKCAKRLEDFALSPGGGIE